MCSCSLHFIHYMCLHLGAANLEWYKNNSHFHPLVAQIVQHQLVHPKPPQKEGKIWLKISTRWCTSAGIMTADLWHFVGWENACVQGNSVPTGSVITDFLHLTDWKSVRIAPLRANYFAAALICWFPDSHTFHVLLLRPNSRNLEQGGFTEPP